MKDIVKLIRELSQRHSTYKIYSDFVEMSAIAMSNATDKAQFDKREKRYLDIAERYSKEEINEFPKLLGMLVNHLEKHPHDVLRDVFHELALHNERAGQFFTPLSICQMMAKMIVGENAKSIVNEKGFVSLSEPACGTGAMVIAAAQELHTQGVNYQQNLHVTAVDLDPTCVHAAFTQFSLLHIPATVIHGNTISREEFSHWFTPAHVLGGWSYKLEQRNRFMKFRELIQNLDIGEKEHATPEPIANQPSPNQRNSGKGTQLKLF
jgi:type I restriction-modification system DNA methylase subunit